MATDFGNLQSFRGNRTRLMRLLVVHYRGTRFCYIFDPTLVDYTQLYTDPGKEKSARYPFLDADILDTEIRSHKPLDKFLYWNSKNKFLNSKVNTVKIKLQREEKRKMWETTCLLVLGITISKFMTSILSI